MYVDKEKFGYQMLLKMGWKEGNGLGKNQQGNSTHLKIEKREENQGVGVENDATGDIAFAKQLDNFDQLLQQLNSSTTKTETKKKIRKTKRKKRKREKAISSKDYKKRLKESSKGEKDSSGRKINQNRLASRKSHLQILRAKNVSSYSSSDLKAILGQSQT